MSVSLQALIALASQLGTKLPLIWPDLVEIGARMKHILEVAGFRFESQAAVPVSDEASNVIKKLVECGVAHDEANRVVAVMEQFDGHFAS